MPCALSSISLGNKRFLTFCCKLENMRSTKELKAFLCSLEACRRLPHCLVLKSMPAWFYRGCWVLLNVATIKRNIDKYQVWSDILPSTNIPNGVLNVKSNVNVRNSPLRKKFLYNVIYVILLGTVYHAIKSIKKHYIYACLRV